MADPAEGFDVGLILFIVKRQLSSEHEATRIESLHWISTLLNRHRTEKISATNKQNRACNEVPPTVGTKSVARRIHVETRKRSNGDWRVQDSPLFKEKESNDQ
nr:protein VAC14 homolog [Tanacetum cinerariifolium]